MHELALAQAILAAAERHAGGSRVTQVDVTVGALRQVLGESLIFNFSVLSRGTVCERAQLKLDMRPARLRCDCGGEWQLSEPSFRCPTCGGTQLSIVDGDQLRVESIELEEEECIAAP